MQAATQNHAAAQYECVQYQIQVGCDLDDCLHFCEQLVEQGNTDIKFILARLLDTGAAGREDKLQAYRYYSQLISAHDTRAKYYQAVLLEEGVVVSKDLVAANSHYEASLTKQPKSRLRLARLLLQSQDGQLSQEIGERAMKLIHGYFDIHEERIGLSVIERRLASLTSTNTEMDADDFIATIDTRSGYANYEIGVMFKEGIGVHQKDITAMLFFKKAADTGDAKSQYQFALLKAHESAHEAYPYFLKAAMQNHSLAQLECINYQIRTNRDLERCLAFCESMTETGNSQAQYLMARLLETGIAGREDKAKACDSYKVLAKGGHYLSQYHLGTMLEEGSGVTQNIIAAMESYQSCYQECFEARLRLACLLLGDGLPIAQDNIVLSNIDTSKLSCIPRARDRHLFLYAESSKTKTKNHELAIELLEFHYENYNKVNDGNSDSIEQELENLIVRNSCFSFYHTTFINTYMPEANYLLGKTYQEGKGVPVNLSYAIQYYRKASSQYPDANYRLGFIYESGLGVAKDWSIAKSFYQKAADKGHRLASKRLTWSYALFSSGTAPPDDATLSAQAPSNCAVM